jgi:hypothetical protein
VHTSRTHAASQFATPRTSAPLTAASVRAGLLSELRGARQQPAQYGQAWLSTARPRHRAR